jgi:hypothetical protein
MAGKRKGRGTVSEPRRPGTVGEKGERGKGQDTANWLEWSHAGRRVRDRHTPRRGKSQVDIVNNFLRRSKTVHQARTRVRLSSSQNHHMVHQYINNSLYYLFQIKRLVQNSLTYLYQLRTSVTVTLHRLEIADYIQIPYNKPFTS